MRAEEIQSLALQQERHWWFRARRRILSRLLSSATGAVKNAVVDLGCGAGFDLQALGPRAGLRVGVETERAPLRAARSRLRGAEELYVRGRAECTPLLAGRFDRVMLLDVLEHLEDDAAALREAARLLKPGGRLLVTAPAFPALWSEHDEALGHRRRYSRAGLLAAVAQAGFEVERATYFTTLLFPFAAFWRLGSGAIWRLGRRGTPSAGAPDDVPASEAISDARRFGAWGGEVLESIFALERFWLPRFNLPIGLSVLVLARKRQPGY